MDGLECTEILFSRLNSETRLDAEYFSKQDILLLKRLKNLKHTTIGAIADVTDGIHTSIDYDDSSSINLISATSPRVNYFDLSRGAKISEIAHKANPRTALKRGDIIISTVGTIGNCAVVDDSILPANSDRHVGIIRVNNIYSPYLISTFLLSKYGRFQTRRETTENVQPNLFIYKIKELLLPRFGSTFQKFLEAAILKSQSLRKESLECYRSANQTFISLIDLNAVDLNVSNTALKNLSESYAVSGRLDAEYYQPKYESIQRALNAKDTVRTLCNLHDRTFLPKPKEEYRYIELADVGTSGFIADVESQRGVDLPTRARRKVKRGQVIVSSVEGSLQSCALITDEYDNALCSTGFYVVDSAKINPETLLVLFKSEPIQALMKQRCSGTILTAISKDEFLSMPLPFIGDDVQSEIARKVQESFSLRHQSEKFIETAVRAVEIAIEQDEAAAVAWQKSVMDF